MQDGVQIAHQHQGYGYLILDGLQLREEFAEAHTVLQGLSGGTLDDRSVGQWVAEGNTYFHHGNAFALHGEDHIGSAL